MGSEISEIELTNSSVLVPDLPEEVTVAITICTWNYKNSEECNQRITK